MRFRLDGKNAFLVSNGVEYPVTLNGDAVILGDGRPTDKVGTLTLIEVKAKIGDCVEAVTEPIEEKPKRTRKKANVD